MNRTPHTYTKDEILDQLTRMGAPTGSIVLMHSSLRAIGTVEGGSQALLDILVDYFTQDGGLFCVPAHTWDQLGQDITLDMNRCDSCLGAFAKIAIADPRGIRSENPCHSMVVFGQREKALDFIRDELDIASPTAVDSCYGKIFDMDGYILLAGVAQNRNTCLHTVDEFLHIPNRMDHKTIPTAVRRKNGEILRRDLTLFYTDYIDDISCRFVKYDTAFRYHRCITDGFLGNAPVQLCNARMLRDTIALIYQNSNGQDPLASEYPIPQTWYCHR